MIRRRSSVVVLALLAGVLPSGAALAQQPNQPPLLPPLPTPPQAVPPAPPAPPVAESPPPPPALPQLGVPGQPFLVTPAPAQPRFNFKIEAGTPLKDLLPVAPKGAPARGPLLTDDLNKVPEAEFEARPEKFDALTERTAHQLAKINHLNAKKADAFMGALVESRPDLAGLPFVMGDDCRTGPERAKQFTQAVEYVRACLQRGGDFWTNFNQLCDQHDASLSKSDKALKEHVTLARLAALTQMLAPESAEVRLGLVKYLTGVPHVEATRALAKLAIFAPEDEVRLAAIESLKVRREKDYTDILVKGLRYPLPAVAKRAADAIARANRTDLLGELVSVLDDEDPRLPQAKKNGKGLLVRELVKVNHHRNCMMCHAPGTSGVAPASAVTAEVPVQGQPLPSPAQGYQRSSPELMIRIDVTYLRQDFSAKLAVGDAHPWPELQRFDFLVRERAVSEDEAALYRERLTPKEPGVLSPYHKAALAALRDLTGKDTAPTAAAWRKLLDAPKPGAKPGE